MGTLPERKGENAITPPAITATPSESSGAIPTGETMEGRIRRINPIIVLLAIAVLGVRSPSLSQEPCGAKTDPPAFQGGNQSDRFNFSYFSDADDPDGRMTRWCYERTVFNAHSQRQLWVHWKDSFGDIMNFLIGPRSRHAVYQKNLQGAPVGLPGNIFYGEWEGVKAGELGSKVWRSAEEAQRQTSRGLPPIISGFEVTPFLPKENRDIPIRMELRSEFEPKTNRLSYVIVNFQRGTPLWVKGTLWVKGQERFPAVEWVVSELKPVQEWLKNKAISGVIDSGSRLSIVLDGVPDVVTRSGPITIMLGDQVIFKGSASAYVPAD